MARKLLSPVLYPQNRNQLYFMEDPDEKPEEDKSSFASFCIAAIPFLALTIGLPFANRLEPRIFGLPFLLAYLVFWSVAIGILVGLALLIVFATTGTSVVLGFEFWPGSAYCEYSGLARHGYSVESNCS